jgi:sec-independent protein translocase protein TatA
MKVMLAGMFGGWEILLIFAVVLIMFGAKKLPELAKGLGSGIKEFKKAASEVTGGIQNAAVEQPRQNSISSNLQTPSGGPPVMVPPRA